MELNNCQNLQVTSTPRVCRRPRSLQEAFIEVSPILPTKECRERSKSLIPVSTGNRLSVLYSRKSTTSVKNGPSQSSQVHPPFLLQPKLPSNISLEEGNPIKPAQDLTVKKVSFGTVLPSIPEHEQYQVMPVPTSLTNILKDTKICNLAGTEWKVPQEVNKRFSLKNKTINFNTKKVEFNTVNHSETEEEISQLGISHSNKKRKVDNPKNEDKILDAKLKEGESKPKTRATLKSKGTVKKLNSTKKIPKSSVLKRNNNMTDRENDKFIENAVGSTCHDSENKSVEQNECKLSSPKLKKKLSPHKKVNIEKKIALIIKEENAKPNNNQKVRGRKKRNVSTDVTETVVKSESNLNVQVTIAENNNIKLNGNAARGGNESDSTESCTFNYNSNIVMKDLAKCSTKEEVSKTRKRKASPIDLCTENNVKDENDGDNNINMNNVDICKPRLNNETCVIVNPKITNSKHVIIEKDINGGQNNAQSRQVSSRSVTQAQDLHLKQVKEEAMDNKLDKDKNTETVKNNEAEHLKTSKARKQKADNNKENKKNVQLKQKRSLKTQKIDDKTRIILHKDKEECKDSKENDIVEVVPKNNVKENKAIDRRSSARKRKPPTEYWTNQYESDKKSPGTVKTKSVLKETSKAGNDLAERTSQETPLRPHIPNVNKCLGLKEGKVTMKEGSLMQTMIHVNNYVMTGSLTVKPEDSITHSSTNTTYFVVNGVAKVRIGPVTRVISSGDVNCSFFIPSCADFSITNEEDVPLKLYFTKF